MRRGARRRWSSTRPSRGAGPTETDVLAAAGLSEDAVAAVRTQERERIPTGRLGRPSDVADWILRIADPRGAHITGQILTTDGGLELA
ncbi:SDR family oxidoreductase [Streptomyces sp. NPDC048419]|uniref:SDR family oxidoreductase n=1 Tax=Streptomyces sp. NPDC048419 TaxID=3365547 RepID=UPI00371152FD